MIYIFHLASACFTFISLLLNANSQSWTKNCLDIKGYSFPRIQLLTELLRPVPDRLRMELLIVSYGVEPPSSPDGIYQANVRQGECNGSFVLPNSVAIVNKSITLMLFEFNNTEIYENFVFEYDKLMVGEVFVANGFYKQFRIQVTIAHNATTANIFRQIGEFQPFSLSKDTQITTESCLTFYDDETLKMYQVKVTSRAARPRPMNYSSVQLRVLSNNCSGYCQSLRFSVASLEYNDEKCMYPRPIILINKYSKSTKLKVDLFDSNNKIMDNSIYRIMPNFLSFSFETGTVTLDFSVIPLRKNSFTDYRKTKNECSFRQEIYLGPVNKSIIMCPVNNRNYHLRNIFSVSSAVVFVETSFDYCVRAKGYYYQLSWQPEGFKKATRLNDVQIRCCTGERPYNKIC